MTEGRETVCKVEDDPAAETLLHFGKVEVLFVSREEQRVGAGARNVPPHGLQHDRVFKGESGGDHVFRCPSQTLFVDREDPACQEQPAPNVGQPLALDDGVAE